MTCVVHDQGIANRECTCADDMPHLTVRLNDGGRVTVVAIGQWTRAQLATALWSWAVAFGVETDSRQPHDTNAAAPAP